MSKLDDMNIMRDKYLSEIARQRGFLRDVERLIALETSKFKEGQTITNGKTKCLIDTILFNSYSSSYRGRKIKKNGEPYKDTIDLYFVTDRSWEVVEDE